MSDNKPYRIEFSEAFRAHAREQFLDKQKRGEFYEEANKTMVEFYDNIKNYKGVAPPMGDKKLNRLKKLAHSPFFDVAAEVKRTQNNAASLYGSSLSMLHVATGNVIPEVVSLLLECGSPVNIYDYHRSSPLYNIAAQNCVEGDEHVVAIVKQLLAAGADPNGRKLQKDFLPIHASRSKAVTEHLLSEGADPTLIYQDGQIGNALHFAIQRRSIDTIPTLLNAGISLIEKNDDRLTPRKLAESRMNEQEKGQDSHATYESMYHLLRDRRQKVSRFINKHKKHKDINCSPDHTLIYYANVKQEHELMRSDFWHANPKKMMHLTHQLPPYFAAKYPKEMTAIYSAAVMASKNTPETHIFTGWEAHAEKTLEVEDIKLL